MKHPLLESLLEADNANPVGPGELDAFLDAGQGRLGIVFLAGDPEKRLETADVAVVLAELNKAHGAHLNIGLVAPDAEAEVMDALGLYTLPSLVFFAGRKRLETLPKIQDWSVYAEALPRLIDTAREEAPA